MPNQQRASVTTRLVFAMALGLALLAATAPLRAGAQAPASVVLLAQRFSGVTTPGPNFDLVQSVIDFGPGATSEEITAPAPHYVSAVGADLTANVDGTAQTIGAGKGIAVPAGARLTISNPNAAGATRAFVSSLLPVAAIAAVHQVSGPRVTIFATSRMTMSGGTATVDIVQSGARYDPGFKSGVHTMNEPHLMTHLEGVTGYIYAGGLSETYLPPTQGQMYVGRVGYMQNVGSERSSFLMTWVSAPGAPLTTAATLAPTQQPPAPAPPNTGTGFGPSKSGPWAPAAIAILGAAMLAGLSLRRRRDAR